MCKRACVTAANVAWVACSRSSLKCSTRPYGHGGRVRLDTRVLSAIEIMKAFVSHSMAIANQISCTISQSRDRGRRWMNGLFGAWTPSRSIARCAHEFFIASTQVPAGAAVATRCNIAIAQRLLLQHTCWAPGRLPCVRDGRMTHALKSLPGWSRRMARHGILASFEMSCHGASGSP